MTDLRAQLLAQLDAAVPASKSHEVFDALLLATRAEVERHGPRHDYPQSCQQCSYEDLSQIRHTVLPCRYLRDLSAALGEEGK